MSSPRRSSKKTRERDVVIAVVWGLVLLFFARVPHWMTTEDMVVVATLGGLVLLLVSAVAIWHAREVGWQAVVDGLLSLVKFLAFTTVIVLTALFLLASLFEGIPRVWEKVTR